MGKAKFTMTDWKFSYGMLVIDDVHYEFQNEYDARLASMAKEMYLKLGAIESLINDGVKISSYWNEIASDIRDLQAKARGES